MGARSQESVGPGADSDALPAVSPGPSAEEGSYKSEEGLDSLIFQHRAKIHTGE